MSVSSGSEMRAGNVTATDLEKGTRNKGMNISKGHVMTSGCGFLWRSNAPALHGHSSIYRL